MKGESLEIHEIAWEDGALVIHPCFYRGIILGMFRAKLIPQNVDDYVQEAAIAIVRYRDMFDPSKGMSMKSWLYPKVISACRDWLTRHGKAVKFPSRRETFRETRVVGDFDLPKGGTFLDSLESDLQSQHEELFEKASQAAIEVAFSVAVDELPLKAQIAWRMRFLHEKKQEEIAESLNVTASRVSQILTRTAPALRKKMWQHL